MKTQTFISRLFYVLLFSALISTNFGCAAFFDAELNGKTLPMDENGKIDYDKLQEEMIAEYKKDQPTRWYPQSLLEASGGFGLNSTEGENETSFCVGAGYNYRISEDNYNNASYVGVFANHLISNADQYKFNKTQFGLQYNLYDRVVKGAELDLTYGIRVNYETGSVENSGFNDDFTGYQGSLQVGANFNVNDNFSLGLTIPFLSTSQRTTKFTGGEIKTKNTWLGLNKDNMVMAYARIGLGK